MPEAGAKILPFPDPAETAPRVVNDWVKCITLPDAEISRLEGAYRRRGMEEERHIGREVLNITDVELSFAEAVLGIVEGIAMIEQPGLEIFANIKDKLGEEGHRLLPPEVPLFVMFTGWYDGEEVTARSRDVLAGTDKILEGLGLDFRLAQDSKPH